MHNVLRKILKEKDCKCNSKHNGLNDNTVILQCEVSLDYHYSLSSISLSCGLDFSVSQKLLASSSKGLFMVFLVGGDLDFSALQTTSTKMQRKKHQVTLTKLKVVVGREMSDLPKEEWPMGTGVLLLYNSDLCHLSQPFCFLVGEFGAFISIFIIHLDPV